MTPAPRRIAAAALLALAVTMTGCATPSEPTSPAPSTWAIPTETAIDARTAPTVPTPQTAVAPSDDPASGAVRPLAIDPVQPTGIPTATAKISNPTYDINNVDLGDPAQVAWAYLTHRLSHSYTDSALNAGLTAAAEYAGPELAARLAGQAEANSDTWKDLLTEQQTAIATLTRLSVYETGDRATVVTTWALTVSALDRSSRTSAGLSTSVALARNQRSWEVVDDSLGIPD